MIQTYPNEICPRLVYLGRREHAINSQIVKDLKFRAYVNCTKHDDFMFVIDFYINCIDYSLYLEYKMEIQENTFVFLSMMFMMQKISLNSYAMLLTSYVCCINLQTCR